MQSAWSEDFTNIPDVGTQFLIRHPGWSCPIVVKDTGDGIVFCDFALALIGTLDVNAFEGAEWCLIPS